jgi:hypothetical protein
MCDGEMVEMPPAAALLCTVDLLIPNFFAADRTVALLSMMYAAKSQARSSMFDFNNITPGNSHARLYAGKMLVMRGLGLDYFTYSSEAYIIRITRYLIKHCMPLS